MAVERDNLGYIDFCLKYDKGELLRTFKTRYGADTHLGIWAIEKRCKRAFQLIYPHFKGSSTVHGITCLAVAVIRGFNEFIAPCFTTEWDVKVVQYNALRDVSIFELAESVGNLRGLNILREMQGKMGDMVSTECR